MPTSEARIAANQANALRSTGPRTAEGKERSRRNGLKHGLSGSGAVVAEDDAAESERRAVALRSELGPKSEVGEILVRQMATLSVRMERSARREFAEVAARVRHAADDFDEARIEAAGALLGAIDDDPKGHLRRLRKSPEGVDCLIEAWQDLRAGLVRKPRPTWTAAEMVRAANLLGIRSEDARTSPLGILSRAVWGDSGTVAVLDLDLDLEEEESADEEREAEDRKATARAKLAERIDEAVAELLDHRETLDFETIELDRAEAGDRALFDPSRPASLARRYESEARRGFFRALHEFRQEQAAVEATGQVKDRVEPVVPAATDSQQISCGPLGSSRFGPASPPRDPQDGFDRPVSATGRPISGPAGEDFRLRAGAIGAQ